MNTFQIGRILFLLSTGKWLVIPCSISGGIEILGSGSVIHSLTITGVKLVPAPVVFFPKEKCDDIVYVILISIVTIWMTLKLKDIFLFLITNAKVFIVINLMAV